MTQANPGCAPLIIFWLEALDIFDNGSNDSYVILDGNALFINLFREKHLVRPHFINLAYSPPGGFLN